MTEIKPKAEELAELKSLAVLYVEDEPEVREQLTKSLRRRVGQLWVAGDGQEGLELFRLHRPQIVVTDILMPRLNGLAMAAAIRELDGGVPILVTTAFEQIDYLLRFIEIGVDGYITKPIDLERLYATMVKCTRLMRAEQMLRESEERYRLVIAALFEGVILMDAEGKIRASNPSAERILGVSVEQLSGGTPFDPRWQPIHENGSPFPVETQPTEVTLHTGQPFHDVIMGIHKPDGSLAWLSLNSQPLFRSGDAKPYAIVASFADITERKHDEDELLKLQAKLREEAIHDPLTDLYNRRYLEETLKRELARAARDGLPLSIFMGDIDFFKQLNDTYGHQAGDEVLRALGGLLLHHARTSDIPCRYGGEEFVVVLPNMPLETAQKRAEHVRRDFEDQRIVFGGDQIHATLSIGVSAFPRHGTTVDELIGAADKALYEAKNTGRNKVCLASSLDFR